MPAAPIDPAASSGAAASVRILVVEDAEEDSALLELELRRGGIDAICERVDSADGMRRALQEGTFDIVLCDYVLPGFGVQAALDILEELDREIPFIVISGVVQTTDVVQVLRSGADDFIEKDDLARFVPAVERALRSAKEHRVRLQTEEQLRQAQKMEAVGQLTGGIAHDFNNLLTTIKGYLELTQEQLGNNPDLALYVGNSIKAVQRCADLTLRLLAFSRKQPLSVEATDINLLASGMVELLRRTLGSQIKLKFIGAPDLWIALIDPGQLENALLNLAINARDAMPDGGSLTMETTNETLGPDYTRDHPEVAPGPYVAIAMRDTGIGMSQAIIDHIFEPFFTTKKSGKGSGLGLSMVFDFVMQSGGHVSIDSDLGQGTTIRLYLPKADEETSRADPVRLQDGEMMGAAETVLLLEDDADLREFVTTALQQLGYDVHEATNGGEALSMLDSGLKPDLLFADLLLPGGLDGIEIAREVTRRCPGTGILFTSGDTDYIRRNRIPDATDFRILAKPFSIKTLAKQVRAAIEDH